MISYKPKENLDEHIVIPKGFPGVSSYTKINVFGCFPAVKMKNTNQVFLGKWRYEPAVPIVIIVGALFLFIMASIFMLPKFGNEGKIINVVSFFLVLLLIMSYLQSIIVGPGYFPFFWSEQNRQHIQSNYNSTNQSDDGLMSYNTNYDINQSDLDFHDDESPSGIITNNDQLNWARTRPRPPRSVISSKAGRIIIRPDHFCDLISSWVGKKNLKFFILFVFYTILCSFLLIIYSSRVILMEYRSKGWNWHVDFLFAIGSLWSGLCFFTICVVVLIVNFRNVSKGYTTLEEMMKIDLKKLDKGCVNNCEDVFGPIRQIPCWLCPTNPWKSKTNDEIVANYISYYDNAFFTN